MLIKMDSVKMIFSKVHRPFFPYNTIAIMESNCRSKKFHNRLQSAIAKSSPSRQKTIEYLDNCYSDVIAAFKNC